MYKCKIDFPCYREGRFVEFKKGEDFFPLSLDELERFKDHGYIEEKTDDEKKPVNDEPAKNAPKTGKSINDRIKEAETIEELRELEKIADTPRHIGMIRKKIKNIEG